MEKTIFIVLMVLVIGFGTFIGSVGTVSSANDTINAALDSTNDSTDPVNTTSNASTTDTSVSISVSSPTNLGNVVADGSTYSYINITQVNVSAREKKPQGQDKLNLYVNASGDLVSASDSIPINNLKYAGFSNSSETSFSTETKKVKTWDFQPDHGKFYSVSDSLSANYYLTVPLGLAGGTYTTTINYLAVIQQ